MGNLPYIYAVCEIAVAVFAVVGNSLVLVAFIVERRLRKVTNFYIFSLAISDLLIGLLGIPSALLTRVGQPRNSFKTCLLMLSVLVLLCTVSILNLVAVTLDRYWAILHPFCYKRLVSSKTACAAILTCWFVGSLFGLMPLFGWNNGPFKDGCYFIPVMHYNFLVLIFFATIVYPALLMAFCYCRIYAVVIKQLRQITALEQQVPRPDSRNQADAINCSASGSERSLHRLHQSTNNGPNLRLHLQQHANKREVRTAKNLAYIVGFFMICWVPLYTVNCVQAFCAECVAPLWLLDIFIVLSHANSALNPLLYAYHMTDFRNALKQLFVSMTCFLRGRPSGSSEMATLSAPALSKMAAKMALKQTSISRH